MNPRFSLPCAIRTLPAPLLLAVLQAQPIPPGVPRAGGAAEQNDEPPVVLSVFEVSSALDTGYAASSALAGTRTNEKLANLPNSISVFTADLMSDLALNDFFDAVDFAIGAENQYNDQGTIGAPVGSRTGNQINFRGIPSIRQLRDGYPWFLPADAYNTERIEFARGPGGLAYGDVDPAGIINVSTKRATFRRRGSAVVRYDNFGTQRYSFDYNHPIMPRLGLRINALDSEVESVRQRMGRDFTGLAGALRWEPFKDRRSRLDLTYERGKTTNHLGHLQLNDAVIAYVRGTGTNALDADPLRAGRQVNGVGMREIAAPGNSRNFIDLGGRIYNMQSTATTVFRHSIVTEGANVATGSDPQNPLRYPLQPIPYSILPENEDWGGPDNRHDAKFHGYTIEFTHAFNEKLRVLLSYNGQVDDAVRPQTYTNRAAYGSGGNARAVFIDVNPNLPHPTVPGATVPNPRFEEYYVLYSPVLTTDGHDIHGWRGSAVYDLTLPFWQAKQRLVAGAGYRREKSYLDFFAYAIAAEEAARRGLTGVAARYNNNLVYPVHYLADGNGEETLRQSVIPGVTTYFRTVAGNNQRFDQTLGSGSLTALGSYFRERLHTSVGLSRDYFRQNRARDLVTNPATGELHFIDEAGNLIAEAGPFSVPFTPFNRTYATNQTYGGVWRVLPWLALGGGYFESSLFTDSVGVDLNRRPLLPRSGEGHELSLRLNILDNRLNATLTRFETVAENNAVNLNAGAVTELNAVLPVESRLGGNGDYRDQTSKGWELELFTNITPAWTLRATYSESSVRFTRFFPLVRPYLAAARTAAQAQGIDADTATALTRQFLDDQEGSVTSVRRVSANVVTRYSFNQGRLKGLVVGTSARYANGKEWAARTVGGEVVLPATRTDDYILVNPFVSYRRKIAGRMWSLQLNVNNAFDLHSNQGNSWVWPRFTAPRQFVWTATVEF